MAVFRAQISFQLDTAFPRDAVTITPHYQGDNAQALADALKTNLMAHSLVGAAGLPFKVRVYDAEKPPPSYPLASSANGTGFVPSSHPREIALCLSYYSTWNRPSYRGRLYIPGHLIGSQMALRPRLRRSRRDWPGQTRWVRGCQHNTRGPCGRRSSSARSRSATSGSTTSGTPCAREACAARLARSQRSRKPPPWPRRSTRRGSSTSPAPTTRAPTTSP